MTPPAPAARARTPLDDEVAARIRRRGPLPFAEVVELALYDPAHGFYASGGAAGRRGDFLTSPEVGPLFGAVVARALDRWWEEAGRPDPFVVVEAAAGSGMLARTVLRAEPACAAALTYVLAERSAALRARHGDHLELVDAALAFPPVGPDDGATAAAEPGLGPRVVSSASLPAVACAHVVVANELLDNLPIAVAEAGPGRSGDDRWREVRVALGEGDELRELLVPAPPSWSARLEALVPSPAPGARVPVADAAVRWLRRAHEVVRPGVGGRVVVIDYGDTTASLADRGPGEWLRTYADHRRGSAPLHALGTQDITAEVPIDQLAAAHPVTDHRSQAAFLADHGLEELVDEGRRIWHERAHLGDLAALTARSRVREAEALVDPDGLGAFHVLTWLVP